MSKIRPVKPILIMPYGYPGSGKTHFARQLSETLQAAHIQGDRIRHELFEKPRYDKQEDEIIAHLMEYMAEEFLRSGVSVIFDTNAHKLSQRRTLRDIARKVHSQLLLVWLQIDQESAFFRSNRRDKRKQDDKYAMQFDRKSFEDYLNTMQNPKNEDHIVVSGKHTFSSQRSAVIKKLYDLSLVNTNTASNSVVKPGMVNLVPKTHEHHAGRVDISRRNIFIR